MEMKNYFDEIIMLLEKKFEEHKRNDIYYRLGYTLDKSDGYEAFIRDMERLKKFIDNFIERAKWFDKHECVFGMDDKCIHCGLDGRA